jgi:hypothetical protein
MLLTVADPSHRTAQNLNQGSEYSAGLLPLFDIINS